MAKQPVRNASGKFKSQKLQNVKDRRKEKRNGNIKPRTSINKRLSTNRSQDARQNILQKKRKTVVDAREILAKKANMQDARSKINNIRGVNRPSRSYSSVSSVKPIGTNIIRKTDRNGKISLVTNKSKYKSDINTAIQKQLGLLPQSRPTVRRSPKRSVPTHPFRNALGIRKTIMNDMDYHLAPAETDNLYESSLYKWTRPELRSSAASDLINLETTRQVMRETLREELSNGWPTFASHKPRIPPRPQPREYINLVDDDEEMPLSSSHSRSRPYHSGTPMRVSNIRSRLDNNPNYPESHGILSKPKVVLPAGHRIVVSNLQTTVTQDDIKELFEDIGELLSAKLVRPGVAEVIYKNLRDAQKAVDTYHNRQLDGQPMKCLLVNKRPLHQPTALPLKTESMTVSRNNLPLIPPCPPSNKLTPDIGTIHKVLFQKK